MKKKTTLPILFILLSFFIIVLSTACKKDGNPNTSSTPLPTTFVDIDGNVYKTVQIGTQVWMAENLKVTRYRNGDSIPNITDYTLWSNSSSGAYCNYNNDTNNVTTYGRLYNFYTIEDPRNICPPGWHIPTYAEWEILINCLGGDSIAGGKLKETGISHWYDPNTGATNESGFTALASGLRMNHGLDGLIGYESYFWTSTEDSITHDVVNIDLHNNSKEVSSYFYYKSFGFSIRCVKD